MWIDVKRPETTEQEMTERLQAGWRLAMTSQPDGSWHANLNCNSPGSPDHLQNWEVNPDVARKVLATHSLRFIEQRDLSRFAYRLRGCVVMVYEWGQTSPTTAAAECLAMLKTLHSPA